MVSSIQDFKSSLFYRALFAEFLATLILVFVGCGACIDWGVEAVKVAAPLHPVPVHPLNSSVPIAGMVSSSGTLHQLYDRNDPTMVQISLAFGLSITIMAWCIGHVSGGHINPAVTMAMLATRKISLLRAVLYMIVQCAGAITGAGLLLAVSPRAKWGSLGSTTVNPEIGEGQAFAIELVITFVLVLTVFACCDPLRKETASIHPLIIGLSVTVCHLFAVRYTGSSMNPARSLGPVVFTHKTEGHWVYWVGPIVGGTLAGIMYEYLFALEHSVEKSKASLVPRDETESTFLHGHDNKPDTMDKESSI